MESVFVPTPAFGPADLTQPKIDISLRHERLGVHHFSAFQPMPNVLPLMTPRLFIETIVGDRLAIGENRNLRVVAWFVRKGGVMLDAGLADKLAVYPGRPIPVNSELLLVVVDRPAIS